MNSPLIILTGLPATGKSTLAAALAAETGWPLLAKDAVKEPLMAQLARYGAAHSRRLSDASFALLFAMLPTVLATARGVILEGNFRSGEHEAALDSSCVGRPVLQVLCRLPEPQRLTRVNARVSGHAIAGQLAHDARCDRFLELQGERIQLAGDAPLYEALACVRSAADSGGFCV
jgi:predicted kinase